MYCTISFNKTDRTRNFFENLVKNLCTKLKHFIINNHINFDFFFANLNSRSKKYLIHPTACQIIHSNENAVWIIILFRCSIFVRSNSFHLHTLSISFLLFSVYTFFACVCITIVYIDKPSSHAYNAKSNKEKQRIEIVVNVSSTSVIVKLRQEFYFYYYID